ncbi:MAG TPA: polyphosphate kinase 1 [Zoogloea sp.]|uniref:polyphosphate kinase 1 n=1 Tax=Zoogloea sp. TaxID=49181 RepID=UPI002CCEA737|nr:polyphosphate kinase 1 [Zoogloea sp.]HMV18215.1 polyphosphate kinase 1 [Rhodocyclaceae bacterium]HMV63899.1 polyphosphate kinase 1 [Rhodocyclaceae bacterium]HMW52811.1 polyphosphate kinase 1 [Rhodocyclaceae bacterium]HMY48935.1 polyphosphate kinase 1 [Rhodocyclaceae bacterium]HMZ75740.1 polyphosphate kinase 1 [Rhodocyclaceae bacterium]
MRPAPAPRYSTDHFINRELSLLQFQRRVLAQAADPAVPLLERLRFLCIVSSNLDEFFEIRVAGVKEQMRLGRVATTADGTSPRVLYEHISREVHSIISEQYALLNDTILPALAAEGIVFLRRVAWTEAQHTWARDYFLREVMPVLTPIGLDPAHPFPRVLNKSLNFAVELEGRDAFGRNSGAAIVQAPRALPRVIRVPRELADAEYTYVFLSSLLHAHVGTLFEGMNVQGVYQFRVTRNSDLYVDEEEVKDLRATLKGELQQRHFGDGVRLEVADNCSSAMADFLKSQFGLGDADVYRVPGIVNPVRLIQVPDWVDRPDLKYRPFLPARPKGLDKRDNIFAAIRRQDILLHHPFQSFEPVIELLQAAADDPQVMAVKMTVYRTGTDSVLMEHLVRAAQKGKEVTVVLELMARFDEEANISWAARLEEAGAHVVYGVFGYKTHAKMLLLVRREDRGLKRYVHLGTGNYHPRTTRFYTDFGLLTANEEIGADVAEVFKQLTGLGQAGKLRHLWQAPFTLQPNVVAAIRNEAEIARAGRKARIVVKVNALLEAETIEALYDASCAGVDITVIARSVCALKPGVPGLSENIRVRSVVGRFLEHHRIFYFHADGAEKLYLSSADWMERNFFKRIEVAFPILDPRVKRRVVKEGLRPYLGDNCQAWELDQDNHYRRKNPRTSRRAAQELLLKDVAGVTLP